jgi:uncharacterized iron-regulated protein
MRRSLTLALLLRAGCAAPPPLPDVGDVQALLIGEQHDAAAQPALQERWVRTLAARGRLRALALELAERGASTAGLPATASEAQVRDALRWDAAGWPWERYRPAIMAAVRAGVPVLGANLPRSQQRRAMQDAEFDRLLPGPALKAQQQAVRLGHCGLLPESQIRPMTRVQIARDQAMAQTIASVATPGQTVLLLAGAGHVEPQVGVPLHQPPAVTVRELPLPPEEMGKDYCEEMRKEMRKETGKGMSLRP